MRGSTATSRSRAVSGTKTCAPTGSPSSRKSTSKRRSSASRTLPRFAEGLVVALWREAGHDIDVPFLRLRVCRCDGALRHRQARPALRPARSPTPRPSRSADFSITRDAIAAGGRVRGIRDTAQAPLTRKQVDEIEAAAKTLGAAGLLRWNAPATRWKVRPRSSSAPDARRRSGLAGRRSALLVAAADADLQPSTGPRTPGSGAADGTNPGRRAALSLDRRFPAVRSRSGDRRSRSVQPSVHRAPSRRHPPARQRTRSRCRALAYDVVLNGTELGGGSLRIGDPRLQAQVFELLGLLRRRREQPVRLFARRIAAPARRPTAGSPSAWTVSRCCCRAPSRCATSSHFRRPPRPARSSKARRPSSMPPMYRDLHLEVEGVARMRSLRA